ncbi:MAG: nickel pincer cofactor biosynthesis protein LarC [Gloeobacterales cyanobacterium]
MQSSEPKIAYLDCPSGLAGDMLLGALVDTGVPLTYLERELAKLGLQEEYRLACEKVLKNGVLATKVHVHLTDHSGHHHRHLPDIQRMIEQAGLPARAANWAAQVFTTLAQAEGAVHGTSPEEVHFHEVGATDALVDIVGSCLGLNWLGIDSLSCSALPFGGGTVKAAHGLMPVPTPAVIKLWEMGKVPTFDNGIQKELVTPTGAALAVTLARGFGGIPKMVVNCVGLGAGERDLPIPNMVRLWLGTPEPSLTVQKSQESHEHTEVIALLETQMDDMEAQTIGYLLEKLMDAGALDVFTTPLQMKKSRPGTLLTVLCWPGSIDLCEEIIFLETPTLGVRRTFSTRSVLGRSFEQVQTEFGTVTLKLGHRGGKIIKVRPEYEDCRNLAQTKDKPLQEIQQAALRAWYEQR